MRQLFVHAEHEAHFASSHADVACRNVGLGSYMTPQLQHERLHEAHHFGVRLAARREIRSALASAHGQRSQRVLESLLECKEFQNGKVYGRMEADAAFIRADSVVVLHTVSHVGLHVAFVIHPSDPELIDSVGDTQTLYQVRFVELRMLVVFLFDRGQYFFYRLMILRFVGKPSF